MLDLKQECARAYKAGKTTGRYEALAVFLAIYFIVFAIGKLASA